MTFALPDSGRAARSDRPLICAEAPARRPHKPRCRTTLGCFTSVLVLLTLTIDASCVHALLQPAPSSAWLSGAGVSHLGVFPRSLRRCVDSCRLRLRGGEGQSLLVKTLKGESFQVELDGLVTVFDLKKKIAQEKGFSTSEDHLRDSKTAMKIIHQGKLLPDATTLDSFVRSGAFVVLMPPKGDKNKAQQPASPEPKTASTAPPTPAAPPAEGGSSTPSQPATPLPPAPAPSLASSTPREEPDATESGRQNPQAETLVTGDELEGAVRSLCGMGFSEGEVRHALRMAFNNPDRAADILLHGLQASTATTATQQPPAAPAPAATATAAAAAPQSDAQPSQAAAAAPAQPQPTSDGAVAEGGSAGSAGEGPLDFLRQLPQFTIMRQSIQQHPQLLPQLLQQLGRANPQLLALINLHQQEFVRLVNEPVSEEELQQSLQRTAEQEQQGPPPPSPNTVQVSESELQQIERLEQLVLPMGLNRRVVLESWLACDRDEQLAANYMLNNLEDLRSNQE